jgi:hypothetical protein
MMKLLKMIFFIFYFLVILSSLSFSQESIVVTTYYPSPFGSYNELRANRMAVGPNAPMPAVDGQIQAGSISLGGGQPRITFSTTPAGSDYNIILTNANTLQIRGGQTQFTDDAGTPSVIVVNEVWYCTSYP